MSLNVAVAGASGNLGPTVLKALIDAGFNVTVLTRISNQKNDKFDQHSRVARVDYNSLDSLKSALAGHEVVVNTLGGTVPVDIHRRLIDAAVAAQVLRFIPSEFGADTRNPRASQLPVYADKVSIQKHLEEKSLESGGKFTYTLHLNGPFFDWGLKVGFLLKLAGPEVDLYDGGDRPFSATTLEGIGKGVSGIIKNLDATKNKTVYISEAEVTQNQLLKFSNKQLATKSVSTEQLEKDGFAELEKSSPNVPLLATNFLRRAIFGDGYGGHFPAQNLSNKLLGVGRLTEEEVKDIVAKYTSN